jgi:HD-GYP domain-containing protein (c-di-GMP phosphodiesterase class II)
MMTPMFSVLPVAQLNPLAESGDSSGHRMALSEVIGALSYALDLTEGLPPGHCIRVCWIGMNIGMHLGLPVTTLSNLYYTLLLKDIGCSSNAARVCELYGSDDLQVKSHFRQVDTQSISQLTRFVVANLAPNAPLRKRVGKLVHLAIHGRRLERELVTSRCERGAGIAARIGFPMPVADGIRRLDEHWDGGGNPGGAEGTAIPLESRIALLAQVAEVFHAIGGPEEAMQQVKRRSGTWFDPALVQAFEQAAGTSDLWPMLQDGNIDSHVRMLEPQHLIQYVDEPQLDQIAQGFADVIDSKSPYTNGHSRRVADYALAIARQFGISASEARWLNRLGLLHDIGKLGVSNSILDKPGKLDDQEWARVRLHPAFSEQILNRVSVFASMAFSAGSHHERLDGKGYPRGLKGAEIPQVVRILTAADVFDALTSQRPYHNGRSAAESLAIMEKDRGVAFDPDCLDALKKSLDTHNSSAAA